MAGLKPGDRRMIDGVECVVVTGDRVPKRFWAAQRKQHIESGGGDLGATGGSMAVVSMRGNFGTWRFRDDPPSNPFDLGEFYQEALNNFSATENYAVMVPVEYMEAETNEFGVVSP